MTTVGGGQHSDGDFEYREIEASELRAMSDEEFRRVIERLIADDDYEGWLQVSVKRLSVEP